MADLSNYLVNKLIWVKGKEKGRANGDEKEEIPGRFIVKWIDKIIGFRERPLMPLTQRIR